MFLVQNQYSQSDIWKNLRDCEDLPSPPRVASKLIDLSKSDTADFDEVAKTVMLDPAIATKILKLANSSLYKRRGHTENISQAISVFGIAGTLSIALTFSLVKIPKDTPKGLDLNRFWLRSIAAAVICRKLSEICSTGAKEQFYLSGLLQDIGMLALNSVRPDLYADPDLLNNDHESITRIEKNDIGVTHSQIGAWLLEQWSFSEQYIEATRQSHSLDADDPPEEMSILSSCVAVSSYLADMWSTPMSSILHEIGPIINNHLTIEDNQIRTILIETQLEISELAPIFEVDTISDSAIEEYLADSKLLLMNASLDAHQRLEESKKKITDLEISSQDLQHKLDYDELTQVHSRTFFYDTIARLFQSSKGSNRILSVVFIDVDNFKCLNDTHGHAIGDLILKEVSARLKNAISSEETIARVGGEEFIILVDDQGYVKSSQLCDRLIATFKTPFRVERLTDDISITISAGLSVHGEDRKFIGHQELIEAADEACYAAKNSGKNKWVFSSDSKSKKKTSREAKSPGIVNTSTVVTSIFKKQLSR